MKCQSYGFAEAARIRTSTLSPSISGLRISLSSSTSAEPYFSYAIAFILFPSWSSLVYTVHLSAKCRCTAYTCQEEIQMAQQIKARRRVQLSRDRVLRAGGFSVNLTHHVMHTIGSRVLGFTQELFNDSRTVDPEMQAIMLRELAGKYPYVVEIAGAASHEGESVVGPGCDDQFEFEFALDLILDGFERLRHGESSETTKIAESTG